MMDLYWRIYYSDNTTFDNKQGKPKDAPPTGVVCIKQTNKEHGWIVTAFKDFYYWEGNDWWGADEVGFWQYMFLPGNKVVKFGVSVSHDKFNWIMGRAIQDKGFGHKSAKSVLENSIGA
jgi:hypothetical protein